MTMARLSIPGLSDDDDKPTEMQVVPRATTVRKIKTIQVSNKETGGKMIINEVDYNPEIHSKGGSDREPAPSSVEESSEDSSPVSSRRKVVSRKRRASLNR